MRQAAGRTAGGPARVAGDPAPATGDPAGRMSDPDRGADEPSPSGTRPGQAARTPERPVGHSRRVGHGLPPPACNPGRGTHDPGRQGHPGRLTRDLAARDLSRPSGHRHTLADNPGRSAGDPAPQASNPPIPGGARPPIPSAGEVGRESQPRRAKRLTAKRSGHRRNAPQGRPAPAADRPGGEPPRCALGRANAVLPPPAARHRRAPYHSNPVPPLGPLTKTRQRAAAAGAEGVRCPRGAVRRAKAPPSEPGRPAHMPKISFHRSIQSGLAAFIFA